MLWLASPLLEPSGKGRTPLALSSAASATPSANEASHAADAARRADARSSAWRPTASATSRATTGLLCHRPTAAAGESSEPAAGRCCWARCASADASSLAVSWTRTCQRQIGWSRSSALPPRRSIATARAPGPVPAGESVGLASVAPGLAIRADSLTAVGVAALWASAMALATDLAAPHTVSASAALGRAERSPALPTLTDARSAQRQSLARAAASLPSSAARSASRARRAVAPLAWPSAARSSTDASPAAPSFPAHHADASQPST
mmetsp:Transcript_18641/g.70795  ORF Transcript_18641/g.70795 Transcript_18641/m.70795 type:complete len:266 (-) Transcript_18641:907-1704(-)